MQHIVTKFGGTSVSTHSNWHNIAAITKAHIAKKLQPIIVCSALTDASNQLEKLVEAAILNEHHQLFNTLKERYLSLADSLEVAHNHIDAELSQLEQWLTGISLLKQAPASTIAQVLSLGEIMMTRLGSVFLTAQGIHVAWFDAREAIITTSVHADERSNYLSAHCLVESKPELAELFFGTKAHAIITQGFIGANPQGETVLLGRGGSDTSGALFAAMVNATACEIWTDVPGIYTANPHQLPQARLLKQLDYDEAQEIASMGAKVLHPNCIPPVRKAGIPMMVKYTAIPEHPGTRISKDSDEMSPPIKSILAKHSITLISIDTLSMWQQVGFLADVFAEFKKHGFSVDLLSSSEFNITVSLDNNAKLRDRKALDALVSDLNNFCRAKVIEPCSAVSLVGHRIRSILPMLSLALEVFDNKQIHQLSLASNDLNFTFVVDESQANQISQKLHQQLIENNPQSFYYSKSWIEEFGNPVSRPSSWWEVHRNDILQKAEIESPCYLYHLDTVKRKATELKTVTAIDQLFYAVKANPHAEILKTLYQEGISLECVSKEEIEHVLRVIPGIKPDRILFTPNFAAKAEYVFALKLGCHLTIDNLYPLEHWPELFDNQSLFLRLDTGVGSGHHKFVCTGGDESKFGIPKDAISQLLTYVERLNIQVIGLHAHAGSGILSPELWQDTALFLNDLLQYFPHVRYLNLGGGLGVVEKPAQSPLNLETLNQTLQAVKSRCPNLQFWLEPGRFFVSEAGVILAKVTQTKEKGKVRFIGIETGMNSLIRPMLYGAFHEIVNLTRFGEEVAQFAHIVGPICESSDTLGYDRPMPKTQENDIVLIANAGAYGYCMGSSYNMRLPAAEHVL